MIHRFAVVVVLLSASAIGQTSHWAAAGDKTAQWMISMEGKWAQAACDNNPVAETLLADDFLGTAPTGERYDKKAELNDARHPTRHFRGCKLGEVKVRFFGDHVALLYGSESRVRTDPGKEGPETLVWTDTWLKRNGKWQIIAAQDGRLDAPAAPKASTDSPLQFLLASAAGDFHAHPPRPAGFRDVRLGQVTGPDGATQYLLCGEFLPAQDKGQGKWTPFATIKTSGYEQWLGDTDYCRRPNIVWSEEDLSPLLQSRFDALQ